MRIVHIRKQPNFYSGHADEGYIVFDDNDIYYNCSFSVRIKERTVYDYLYLLELPSINKDCKVYEHTIRKYTDVFSIPNVCIVAEYIFLSHPELFI